MMYFRESQVSENTAFEQNDLLHYENNYGHM